MSVINKIAINPRLEMQNIDVPKGTRIIDVDKGSIIHPLSNINITVLYPNVYDEPPTIETKKLVVAKPYHDMGNYKTTKYIGAFYINQIEHFLFEVWNN